MLLSLLIAALVLELWKANLRVPIFPFDGSDGGLTLASIKGVLDHGWYETNANLGAPFGQVNHDFPLYIGELGSILEIKGLSLFSSQVAVVLNAFVMLGFPLAALTAFLVLRRLGLSRPVALTCGVFFSVMPFHFTRAEAHLFLANYYAVPVGAYLILCVSGFEPPFSRRAGVAGWRSWVSRRSLSTLALCLLVGIGGLYYAAFTVLLVALAGSVGAIARRRWSSLVAGMVVIAAIGVPVFATAVPEILYKADHGANHVVGDRQAVDSLAYGLPPIQLVLPVPHHRIGALAALRTRYDSDSDRGFPGVQQQMPNDSLGSFGTIGLAWLLAGLLATALGRGWREPLARHAGVAAALAVALGATSGLGALFAYVVTPQIRAWDRIAILIGFFSLIGLALLLTRGVAALRRRRRGRVLGAGFLAATLCLAVLDGTSPQIAPDYAAAAASWRSEAALVSGIQYVLPRGAMVLEFPYIPYPEAVGPNGLGTYSMLVPYLHSTTLRWSAGAMAGRASDWLATASTEPLEQLIRGSVAAGFLGVYVDRRGYSDGGSSLASQITALTGATPIASSDGQALFFDLMPYAASLRAQIPASRLTLIADATTRPMFFGDGFFAATVAGGHSLRWAQARSQIQLSAGETERVRFTAVIKSAESGNWVARLELPGGGVVAVPVSAAGTRVDQDFGLRPGTSVLTLTTTAPRPPGQPQDLHIELIDPTLTRSAAS
jgi:phosphoglycerol transferase